MKVIKKGTIPDKLIYRGTCHHCKSVVEATRGELGIEYDQRGEGDFGREKCPVCNTVMIFHQFKGVK